MPGKNDETVIYYCDICGYKMIEHNCELICPNCGARRDCTDP